MHSDEARLARDRIEDQSAALAAVDFHCPDGSAALIGKTASEGSYPTAAVRYYALDLYLDNGAESEGAAMAPVALSARVHALNLGGSVPPAGTYVLASAVGDRWVFSYG